MCGWNLDIPVVVTFHIIIILNRKLTVVNAGGNQKVYDVIKLPVT